MDDIDRRIEKYARHLWREAGRPASGVEAYVGRARELVAIEDNQLLTTRPLREGENVGAEGDPILPDDQAGPSGEPVEPIEALTNEGEFPTLTDQGEQQSPDVRNLRGGAGHR